MAAFTTGVDTYDPYNWPLLMNKFSTRASMNKGMEDLFKIVFAIEFAVKLFSEGAKPWQYFVDAWNLFDFTILAFMFAPINAGGDMHNLGPDMRPPRPY
jgi:hypothetical protein